MPIRQRQRTTEKEETPSVNYQWGFHLILYMCVRRYDYLLMRTFFVTVFPLASTALTM